MPWFYTLAKIYKPKPVGRPISGCWQTIQPIAKIPKSYIKDTTDLIDIIRCKNLPENILHQAWRQTLNKHC